MKRTGEILKNAREKKGLSINEVALALKISSKILKAIEDGDPSQLPPKTFLRGFVQSYSNYLRLNANEVLRVFQAEMGTTKPSPLIQMPEQDATLESFEKKKSEPATKRGATPAQEKSYNKLTKTNNNSKTITFTLLGLILVGLIVFTKKMIDKYQKESAIADVEVAAPIATPPQEVAADLTHPSPSPTATVTAMSTPLVTPTPEPTPIATVAETPAPSPSPTATPMSKPLEVIIEALDNVDIDYITKDGQIERIHLNAEQVHTFKSKSGIKLNISNGGAVDVIVNGKDLGIPGNLGKPVKLSF